MSNPNIQQLTKQLNLDKTLVVNTKDIEWLTPQRWQNQQSLLLGALEQWRSDWASLNTHQYLSHYSTQFKNPRMNYAQWVRHKTQINKKKTFINVTLSDISIVTFANLKNAYAITFKQRYESNGMRSVNDKTQIWQLENNKWKITYEGKALF